MRLACSIKDVEHLPHVIADHGIGKRRCEPVQINSGKVVQMPRLRFFKAAEHPLCHEDRDRGHEDRNDQRHLDRERQPKRAHPALPRTTETSAAILSNRLEFLDAEAVEPEHPQDRLALFVFAHSDEGLLEPLYARVARKACRAGDRRETQEFGLAHDPSSADELGLGLAHDFIDVTIDAAARRQPGRDCPHDVAVAPGEERLPEEPVGRLIALRQRRGRHQPSGVAVRVGKGVHVAFKIIQALRSAVTASDQVGAVQGLALPHRHRHELKLRPVGDEWEPADPGGIKLSRDQKGRDFLVCSLGDEPNTVGGPAL